MKALKKNYFLFLIVVPVLVAIGVGLLLLKANGILFDRYAARVPTFSEEVYDPEATTGTYEGQEVIVPKLTFNPVENAVLGVANEERWIEVDLSEQKIRAWEGGNLYLESLISTGLPWWPTPQGEFRIWDKVRATKMEGGSGKYYYYLPNVPYVMFFENDKVPGWRGFSLHGTYWHNDFGRVHSHGCVNLPTPVAERLYYWVSPVLPAGKSSVMANAGNIGTRIVIHE
jgi:lipoprotein-anchoring transpeptidase ErfK/SrfK